MKDGYKLRKSGHEIEEIEEVLELFVEDFGEKGEDGVFLVADEIGFGFLFVMVGDFAVLGG